MHNILVLHHHQHIFLILQSQLNYQNTLPTTYLLDIMNENDDHMKQIGIISIKLSQLMGKTNSQIDR